MTKQYKIKIISYQQTNKNFLTYYLKNKQMEIANLIRGRGSETRLAHNQICDGSTPSPVKHLLNEITNKKIKKPYCFIQQINIALYAHMYRVRFPIIH